MKIAILGAECTGKTQLAQALASLLRAEHHSVGWVPEYLREWCEAHQRTPRADEQGPIAQVQMDRVNARTETLLLCDTSPLMTAVYSDVLFGDLSLYAQALQAQRHFGLTLVTAPDLPWVADGLQRDGVATRDQVNARLRTVLAQYGVAFSMVYGTGAARTDQALQAIRYALGAPGPGSASSTQSTHSTRSTRSVRSGWRWACEKCSDPQCEHRLFQDLAERPSGP